MSQHAGAVLTIDVKDVRCFETMEVEFDPAGLTVLTGSNGSGKTTLLEAIFFMSAGRSFRPGGRDSLVRSGEQRAFIHTEVQEPSRRTWLHCEVPLTGPTRTVIDHHKVRSRAELSRVLAVTVFSPNDLELVQGPPAARRTMLDEVLAARHPSHEADIYKTERVLRQRAALLRQASNRPDAALLSTLDVWDARLGECGESVVRAREQLVHELEPVLAHSYSSLTSGRDQLHIRYRRSWEGELLHALLSRRKEDLRRQVTGVGPHRDELELYLDKRPVRTEASQGEQRSVALALRLALHLLVSRWRSKSPVLLLDDVFSELDRERSGALLRCLPDGQAILTTATGIPAGASPAKVIELERNSQGLRSGP